MEEPVQVLGPLQGEVVVGVLVVRIAAGHSELRELGKVVQMADEELGQDAVAGSVRVLGLAIGQTVAAEVAAHKYYQAVEEAGGRGRTALYWVDHKANRQQQHPVWLTRTESSRCQVSAVVSEQVVLTRSAQLVGRKEYRKGLV